MQTIKHLLLAMVLLAMSSSAWASFSGQTIQLTYFFPDLGSGFGTDTAVVGTGVEWVNFISDFNIDFSSENVLMTFTSSTVWTPAAHNGPVFTDINGTIPPILGVTINPATNMVGFDISRITYTADSITVNWQGLSFDTATIVSLDVQFPVVVAPAQPVPTMSSWALALLAGLLGFVGFRRRTL